jgi:Ca2+-transporting ATPase
MSLRLRKMSEVVVKNISANQATSPPYGLGLKEVEELKAQWGSNDLSSAKKSKKWKELVRYLKDPMGLMLLSLAIIYGSLGDSLNATILIVALGPVLGIDVLLQIRADQTLKSLSSSIKSRVKVYREGQQQVIKSSDVVPGDWILIEEGQRLVADGILHNSSLITINEMALTGESLPVEKTKGDHFCAGTTVIQGNSLGVITAIGRKTKFGKIADLLDQSTETQSPLQIKIKKIVKQLLKISSILVLGLFLGELYQGRSGLEALISALTFAMAAIPEEFPLVFSLYLSFGAWRLAKRGVLVKSLPSVETLGSVSVLCTDKTGTLTEGRFVLKERVYRATQKKENFTLFAALACEPLATDAMERALLDEVLKEISLEGWSLVYDYPFEGEGKHITHAWRHRRGEEIIAMKGAIEGVLSHCQESPELKQEFLKEADALAAQGFRLLALAGISRSLTGVRESDEKNLNYLGLLVFSDPLRPSVKQAVDLCQKENIVIKMITGDHPATAHAIAEQMGLAHSHDYLFTGQELRALSSEKRKEAYLQGAIFSRVSPEQKYELVNALRNDGHVVAMTGDGVNDAPALKIADIGISMGMDATDTARSTAKMVLLKNDFQGLVDAIIEGRKVFANLQKSFSYLISFHIPLILLTLIPPLLGTQSLLLPIHIILLQLIVHPISVFVFDNHQQYSRKLNQVLLSQKNVAASCLAGCIVSMLSIGSRYYFFTVDVVHYRTHALSLLLWGNIGFILLETLPRLGKKVWFSLILLFSLTGILLWHPLSQKYLQIVPLAKFEYIIHVTVIVMLVFILRLIPKGK